MTTSPSSADVERPAASATTGGDAGAAAVHWMHSAGARAGYKALTVLLVVGTVAPALFVGARPGQFLHSLWTSLPLLALFVWGIRREANARLKLGPEAVTTCGLWGRRSLRLDDVASVDVAPDYKINKNGRIEGRRLVMRSRTPRVRPIDLFVPDRRPLPPALVARLLGIAPPAATASR